MKLPIKKVYVNSRYKTADSVSDSNFKFELPYVLTMPSDAIFYITDVCIPNLFKTIARGENDDLYYEYTAQVYNPIFIERMTFVGSITMSPANYTEISFTLALDERLNTATSGTLRARYDTENNICAIYTDRDDVEFKIRTDEEVQKRYNNAGHTINEILNNVVTPSPTYTKNKQMIINRLKLQPIHNIYITSPNLGSYDTVSNFSDNIIKQVPVTSDYGYMIVDRLVSFADYLNCPNATLKTLEFHMRDGRGRYVNLYNNHVSFTIVFDTK